MLKIIDEFNLKDLIKYGFIYDKEMNYYYKTCTGTFNKIIIFNYDDEDVCKGLIVFHNNSAFETTLYLEPLYNLIKADIVEKFI